MNDSSVQDFLDLMKPDVDKEDFLGKYHKLVSDLVGSPQFQRDLKIHNALANPIALQILHLLQQEDMCNCAIAEILGKKPATTAHHLRKLEQAGLILGRRKSYFTIYSLLKQ